MKVNLISPQGKKISLKVSFLSLYKRHKVKKLIREGYILESEKDADIAVKLRLY